MAKQHATLPEAKARLDVLIAKARAHLCKPIGIAETLYHSRVDGIDLLDLSQYRRRSYDWCREVSHILYGRRPELNSRYWDQVFDPPKLPPAVMSVLGDYNRQENGVVEAYIYGHIRDKVAGILDIVSELETCRPCDFDLRSFLRRFEEDRRFRRSVDKAYEIIVYALFNAVTSHLEATVTLSVTPKGNILADFRDFAKLVLGVDDLHPEIRQAARLYRVGTANAADAGLDMWANFGPAVQVKHVSLDPSVCEGICESIQAEQIIIVCKQADVQTIRPVLVSLGFWNRIRGIITEVDLARWYGVACGEKYHRTLGRDLLMAIRKEMALEFPLTRAQTVDSFMKKRGYDVSSLTGTWAILGENASDDQE